MDAEEEEEEEERADESQEMSSDQDRLEDTVTNPSDAGEGGEVLEEAHVAGQGSGDILDETAGSDTLWTLTWDPTCSPQLNYGLLCNSLSCLFCIKNILW